MFQRTLPLLLIGLIGPQKFVAQAQSKEVTNMNKVRVRYMVRDLDPAVNFCMTHPGFRVERESQPNFAMLDLDELQIVLNTPFGPEGAARPMPGGRKPKPDGWNRIIISVNDLQADVARLRQAHLHFRKDIVSRPGGSEILLDDPSGNPVELYQPGL